MKYFTPWNDEYWMESNGFFVGLNTPPAVEGEKEHGLPPYARRKAFLVDEYPACPENWMRSEGKTTSYFVPVKEGQGMWLDLNKNTDQKYHVAMVVSIQGINPITGMPCTDTQLEQYQETCPKCKEAFGPNRFCKKCGYKWPKQNYISTTATPNGQLWLDGFRSAEGVVRQYILTQEKMKGVASNVIGKDRVFAIGISFFLSKEPKPIMEQPLATRGTVWPSASKSSSGGTYSTPTFFSPIHTPLKWNSGKPRIRSGCSSLGTKSYMTCYSSTGDSESSSVNSTDKVFTTHHALDLSEPVKAHAACASEDIDVVVESPDLIMGAYDRKAYVYDKHSSAKKISAKKVEVGAGEQIKQAVYDDPEPLDYWRTTPSSIVLINYALEEDCGRIVKAGRVELKDIKNGWLNKVPVGK